MGKNPSNKGKKAVKKVAPKAAATKTAKK